MSLTELGKPAPASRDYKPKLFSPHEYATLTVLCEVVIPADTDSGGAIEARVPEVLEMTAGRERAYRNELGDGLKWLDAYSRKRYGQCFIACGLAQRREILDLIAFRQNAERNPELSAGVKFFSVLRKSTIEAFFNSDVGLSYLSLSRAQFKHVV